MDLFYFKFFCHKQIHLPSIATKNEKKCDKSNFLCIPIYPFSNFIRNKTSSYDIRGYCKCPRSYLKVFKIMIYSLMIFNPDINLFGPMLSPNKGFGFKQNLYLRSNCQFISHVHSNLLSPQRWSFEGTNYWQVVLIIYLVIMYIMTQVATIQHVGITYYYFMMEVLEPTTIKRMILKQMICAMQMYKRS